jgi:hypothetical protein
MSFQYQFTKTIEKPIAFEDYLVKNFPLELSVSIELNTVNIGCVTELTTEQLTLLTTLITDYTDPAVFLQLAYTESMIGASESTMTTTLKDVQTFIYESVVDAEGNNVNNDGTKLDCIKSILKLTADDISVFSDLGTGSVDVELYDSTRDIMIDDITIDISSILADWQTRAQNNETGPVTAYKSFMIFGLLDKGTNFDCIWTFRLAVSDVRIKARLNGLQKLFYYLI